VAAADRRELPVLVCEVGHRGGDAGQVVVVGEEGAVAAAAVVRPAGDDAGAAAAEDAGPGGRQPGEIGADDVLGIGRIGELEPFPGEVEADFLGRITGLPGGVRAHLPSLGRSAPAD
jgi:hypothetical protein